MSGVDLEPVMRLAPEVRARVGLDPQELLGGSNQPASGLAMPAESAMHVRLVERLVEPRLEHRSTLHGAEVRWKRPSTVTPASRASSECHAAPTPRAGRALVRGLREPGPARRCA